jgi:myosin heavy subunit
MGDELENEIASLEEEGLVDLIERRSQDHLYSFRIRHLLFSINVCERMDTDLVSYHALAEKERYHHLYSVPDRALRELEKKSQSIVMFGDSGSG